MKTNPFHLRVVAAVAIAFPVVVTAADNRLEQIPLQTSSGLILPGQPQADAEQGARTSARWDGPKREFRRKAWSKSLGRMEHPPVITVVHDNDSNERRRVDLSALKEATEASYEFVVESFKESNLSPILLGDDGWGLKFDQASLLDLRTNQFGFTRFSERDYFFEPVNGASLASPYGRTSHLVFAVGANRTRVFVDGELAGTFAGPGHVYSAADANLGFSEHFPDSSTRFDGKIHAFAAYNRALNEKEIRRQAAAALHSFATILGPAEGIKVTAGQSARLLAAAGSRKAAEVTVEFMVDGKKIGEATFAPFAFSWSDVPRGDHTVRALAVVNGKVVAESGSIIVTGLNPQVAQGVRVRKNTGKALTAAEAGALVLRGSNNLRDWDTLAVLRGIESMDKLSKIVNDVSKEYRFYQLFPDE